MMTNTLLRGVSRSSLAAMLALCSATAAHADATPECNDALGLYRTECGTGSHAGADVATAVGAGADVTADGTAGTAVGAAASVGLPSGVSLGAGAVVGSFNGLQPVNTGIGGIAIGTSAASGLRFIATRPTASIPLGGIAIGYASRSQGDNNVALGSASLIGMPNNFTPVSNSTAIGAFTTITADNAIALGQGATVTANSGLAIGSGVTVNGIGTALIKSNGDNSVNATGLNSLFVADNSVAIGAGSVTEQAGSIAIGRSATVNKGDGFGAIPQRVPEVGPAGSVVIGQQAVSNGDNNLALGNYASASGRYDAVNNTLPIVSYATAVGTGATVEANRGTALGHGALVTAPNSVAIGADSVANEADTVAFGTIGNERRLTSVAAGINNTDAVNMGQFNALSAVLYSTAISAQQQIDNAVARTDYIEINSGEGSVLPRATGRDAVAIGSGSVADSASAVAIGNGAQATDGKAVSIGAGNIASGNGAVAIGDPNTAVGTGAVAMGADNTATGDGAVALGNASTARGDGGVAVGNQANAGVSSIAIGNNADAGPAGSVAIGNGAQAQRYNEVAIGNSSASYTFAGLASSGEGTAQPPAFMTVDSQGRVDRSSVGPSDIVNLQGQFATLSAQTANLTGQVSTLSGQVGTLTGRVGQIEARTNILEQQARQANGGIAAAMAMGNAFLPEGQSVAVSFNLATYRGEQGFSGTVVARVSPRIWVSGGVAGSTVGGSTGGRAGITFGW